MLAPLVSPPLPPLHSLTCAEALVELSHNFRQLLAHSVGPQQACTYHLRQGRGRATRLMGHQESPLCCQTTTPPQPVTATCWSLPANPINKVFCLPLLLPHPVCAAPTCSCPPTSCCSASCAAAAAAALPFSGAAPPSAAAAASARPLLCAACCASCSRSRDLAHCS